MEDLLAQPLRSHTSYLAIQCVVLHFGENYRKFMKHMRVRNRTNYKINKPPHSALEIKETSM